MRRSLLRSMPSLLPLAAMALAGCKLIDQTTFFPPKPVPPRAVVAAPKPPPGPPALVTLHFTPELQYRDALHAAVRAALARRADAVFDVVAVVPATGTPAEQAAAAEAESAHAKDVASSITGFGVPDTQVLLGARTDPAVTDREVRVYVR